MKNGTIITGIVCLALSLSTALQAKSTIPNGGGDEFENLKNNTLVVVLLEESQKYEDKLTKAHKAPLIEAYKNNIQTINDNMQAAAKFLSIGKDVEYMKMSEIIALPQATREGYSYLVYDRSAQFDKGSPAEFQFDFYADKDNARQAMLDNYLSYIQFDCADPRYHGEEDYRKIDIIVEGRKRSSDEIMNESLDQIIPTKGSFSLCFMGLQLQFSEAMAGGPRKMTKEDIREQIAKARTKKLLVCKDNLDRNITAAKIQALFKYKFNIVTRNQFDSAIMNQDTSCCLLVVYPVDKTMAGNRPMVNYQHLLVDGETSEVLLTVTPDNSGGGMPLSYQKVTDKHFKDIAKEEDKVTK